MATTQPATEHLDVLIIGAGVSGIGSAYHLKQQHPHRSFAVIERNAGHGGTWWTHRYPGARSDSDLFTYGYRFKPWRGAAIAGADEIRTYLTDVIEENGLAPYIRYQQQMTAASLEHICLCVVGKWQVKKFSNGFRTDSGPAASRW